MCNTCTDGEVARLEGETIYCNFCPEGIGKQLDRLSERINDHEAALAVLRARDALGMLDKIELASYKAIKITFAQLCDEYDALETQFHRLANPMLARMEVATA